MANIIERIGVSYLSKKERYSSFVVNNPTALRNFCG